jgi:pimeloyl-ACP methyl ester carboxylesterase
MTQETTGRLDRGDGVTLAWAYSPGTGPTIVFLPGFRSDMAGSKALWLAEHAAGHAMLRLDYSGHGASGGAFTDGTIGLWTQDALTVIDTVTTGPLLLVGSSMGGWIALLIARARPARITGIVGIAAAPDFTERMMWQAMAPSEQTQLLSQGYLDIPSDYGEDLRITRALIEDGRTHLLLDAPIPLHCPIRLLQGQRDPDVPWETALTLATQLQSPDVQITFIKDGDHRLSRPQDLALLGRIVAALLSENPT